MPISAIFAPGQILKEVVLANKLLLHSITLNESARKPSPEKWSKKEILGHLIDSAANNHQRFVRGQFKEDMVFDGYAQDDWVKIQKYQERNWDELIDLWVSYNLQIADIMRNMPRPVRKRAVKLHNLHKIAFQTIPEAEATSLEYFMVDYVAHLEHHLQQIMEGYEKKIGPYSNSFHL